MTALLVILWGVFTLLWCALWRLCA